MLSIGFRSTPQRRFVPSHWDSSEGFLATFTPDPRSKVLEDSMFDLRNPLENFLLQSRLFISKPPQDRRMRRKISGNCANQCAFRPESLKLLEARLPSLFFHTVRLERNRVKATLGWKFPGGSRFGYVMNPGPKTRGSGILEALNPTDEPFWQRAKYPLVFFFSLEAFRQSESQKEV